MDTITVGEIIKAQGIKGEVKVKALTDNPSRFKKLRLVYIDQKPYAIDTCRVEGEHVFLTFDGVCDRTAAETLKGKRLTIDRVHAVALPEGRYFVVDLIGCDVVDENDTKLGVITDILSVGAADVISAVDGNGKAFRFPFLNRVVLQVEPAQKRFSVIREKLDEVCVYDD